MQFYKKHFFGWLAGLAGWLAGWLAGATGGALDIGDLRNTQSSQGIPRDGARTYHVRCIVHDLDSTQPVHHGLVAKLLDAATTENRASQRSGPPQKCLQTYSGGPL